MTACPPSRRQDPASAQPRTHQGHSCARSSLAWPPQPASPRSAVAGAAAKTWSARMRSTFARCTRAVRGVRPYSRLSEALMDPRPLARTPVRTLSLILPSAGRLLKSHDRAAEESEGWAADQSSPPDRGTGHQHSVPTDGPWRCSRGRDMPPHAGRPHAARPPPWLVAFEPVGRLRHVEPSDPSRVRVGCTASNLP